jgi:ferredoxin
MEVPQSASFLALVSLCAGGPDRVKRRITLHFPREAVHQPIAYRLAVEFDIAAKILRAQIAPNQSGTMVVELSGDIDDLAAAEHWLESQGLGLNRASGQIRVDAERCVDCGICTSVCPSGALSCHAPSWQLQFDAQRCLVCEQCIPTCPFEAIALVLEPSP